MNGVGSQKTYEAILVGMGLLLQFGIPFFLKTERWMERDGVHAEKIQHGSPATA